MDVVPDVAGAAALGSAAEAAEIPTETSAAAANKLPACLERIFAFMAVSWTSVDDDLTIGERQRAVKSLSRTN
ncbi:hypothetical protein MASR2M50_03490 [Thauera sp.]